MPDWMDFCACSRNTRKRVCDHWEQPAEWWARHPEQLLELPDWCANCGHEADCHINRERCEDALH